MTATIGVNLRLPAELHTALQQMAGGRGNQNAFLVELVRREAQRRGLVAPAALPAKRKARKP